MRLTTTRTLLAIAIGIAAAAGTSAAFCGQRGPQWGPGECPDPQLTRLTQRLDLTAEQQTQVKTILEEQRTAAAQLHAQTRQRVDEVLTDAQRAAQETRMQRRLDRHLERLARRLGLSTEQRAQVGTILAERRTNPELDPAQVQERIAAVLTPAQQQQFESFGPPGGRQGCGPRGDGPRGGPLGGPFGGPGDDPAEGPDDEPEGDLGPQRR